MTKTQKKQIESREPNIIRKGTGTYVLTAKFRGKERKQESHDSQLYDEWKQCDWKSNEYYELAKVIFKRLAN